MRGTERLRLLVALLLLVGWSAAGRLSGCGWWCGVLLRVLVRVLGLVTGGRVVRH